MRKLLKPIYLANLQRKQEILTRKKLAGAYQMIAMLNLDDGSAGHLSSRSITKDFCFWTNTYGMHCDEITTKKLVLVDYRTCGAVQKKRPINYSGSQIHAAIYRHRKDVKSIVHLHSPAALIYAMTKMTLTLAYQNASIFHDDLTYYHHYEGSLCYQDEADRIAAAMGKNNNVILVNHGLISVGESIEAATIRAIQLEQTCKLNLEVLKLGETPALISDEVAKDNQSRFCTQAWFSIEFEGLRRKLRRQKKSR